MLEPESSAVKSRVYWAARSEGFSGFQRRHITSETQTCLCQALAAQLKVSEKRVEGEKSGAR